VRSLAAPLPLPCPVIFFTQNMVLVECAMLGVPLLGFFGLVGSFNFWLVLLVVIAGVKPLLPTAACSGALQKRCLLVRSCFEFLQSSENKVIEILRRGGQLTFPMKVWICCVAFLGAYGSQAFRDLHRLLKMFSRLLHV
jgi:hypothetical protein